MKMDKIDYFFRKVTPGAYSINQIFTAIAAEIGKTFDVSIYELNNAGANPQNIIANIVEANRTTREGIHHITGDIHYIALGLRKRYIVLTIHDCVMLSLTPRWHPKFYAYLWLWYKLPIWKSDIVTTISEKSKQEIIFYTRCNPDKIRVVPNFVDEAYQYSPKKFDADCPRILHIGITPNKNLERLAEALSGIPCILEIIGALDERHMTLLKRYRITFENYVDLSLEKMAERYRLADMLTFVSTYEGFGLPIIEAQATGRPVVTSNLEPMTSVAGEQGACFVNPFDAGAIRTGVLKVICDVGFREKLVQNGLKNVKKFTLKEVVRQYMEVYQSQFNLKN